MQRRTKAGLAGCFLLLLLGSSLQKSYGRSAQVQYVLIISIDGASPRVMRQVPMPYLERIKAEGTWTDQAHTVLPSVTLVSHASMITGLKPTRHKINWNSWKPEKGYIPVPTIFTLAKQAGLKTAMFAAKEKFKHFNRPGDLDDFAIPGFDAVTVASVASGCLLRLHPNLMLVHFAEPDSAGHQYGWGSQEQIRSFKTVDKALGILMETLSKAGMEKDTAIIISADHGGHGKTHGSNLPEDIEIPWICWGKGVPRGVKIHRTINTYDTAATALALLGLKVPPHWDGKAVPEVLSSSRTPLKVKATASLHPSSLSRGKAKR